MSSRSQVFTSSGLVSNMPKPPAWYAQAPATALYLQCADPYFSHGVMPEELMNPQTAPESTPAPEAIAGTGAAAGLMGVMRSRRSRRTPSQNAPTAHEINTAVGSAFGEEQRHFPQAGGIDALSYRVIHYRHGFPATDSFATGGLGNGGSDAPDIRGLFAATVARELEYGAIVVICANLASLSERYGDRGIRYALLGAGHFAQNLLLLCELSCWSACPLGGFADHALSDAMNLGNGQMPMYAVVIQ